MTESDYGKYIEACNEYLVFFNLEAYAKNHQFFNYASRYWTHHVDSAEVLDDSAFLDCILKLCDGRSPRSKALVDNLDKTLLRWKQIPNEDRTEFSLILPFHLNNKLTASLLRRSEVIESELAPGGTTGLHYAIQQGLSDRLDMLLAQGTNTEERDSLERTPLHIATIIGNEEFVLKLLSAGASMEARDFEGLSALHIASILGNLNIMRMLISEKTNINAKDKNGSTALHYAAANGDLRLVKLLLKVGANVEMRDHKERTPLANAAISNHLETVELLFAKDADIESRSKSEEIPLISRNANIEARDKFGRTPLSLAAICGHTEIVELLLVKGADIETRDEIERTPLLWAAKEGHKEIVESLLVKNANIETGDDHEDTPFLLAAMMGHTEIVKLLLTKGANIDTRNSYLFFSTTGQILVQLRRTATLHYISRCGGASDRRPNIS